MTRYHSANYCSALLVFLFAASHLHASIGKTAMLTPVKQLVDDPLTQETWDKYWKKAVGIWRWEGDALKGFEKPEDHHHAGAGRTESMQSAIIEIEFRMDDSQKIQLGTDYTSKEKKDHLMRVSITPKDFSVRAGSGWGKTTRYKPVGQKVKMSFKPGKWYKVKMEFHKQEIVVHINDQVAFYGVAIVNQDVEKNRIALNARGVASFRNVKVWSGKLKDDWAQTQKQLAAEFPAVRLNAQKAKKPKSKNPKNKHQKRKIPKGKEQQEKKKN